MKKLFSLFLALLICMSATAAFAADVPRSASKLPEWYTAPASPQIIRVQKSEDTVTITLDRELPRESLVTAKGLDEKYRTVAINGDPQPGNVYTMSGLPEGGQWTGFEIAWVDTEKAINALAKYNAAGGLVNVTRFDKFFNEYVFDNEGIFCEFGNPNDEIRARYNPRGELTCYAYEAINNTYVWFDLQGEILWADYDDGIFAATWEPNINWYVFTAAGHVAVKLNVSPWGVKPLFVSDEEVADKPKKTWFPNNTICLAGLSLQETSTRLPDKWYNVIPVDLTRQGRQTYLLTISNARFIGECYVDVWGDEVTVDYSLIEHSAIEPLESYGRWFTKLSQVTEKSIESKENGFVFGEPLSIAEDLGGADVALLFIRSKATYYLPFPDGTELTRYWRNTPEWKEFRTTLQELVPFVEK